MSQPENILETLVKKIERLERELQHVRTDKSLYTINNINTPAQITSNVNDYDPGDYDVLRMSSDVNLRQITGISGGYPGRVLTLVLVSTTTISLRHTDAGSAAENQIFIPGAANMTMQPNSNGNATAVCLGYGYRNADRWYLFARPVP